MQATDATTRGKRGGSLGWLIAVTLVVVAWAGAFALRGGGEKEVLSGWADGMDAGQQLAEETGKPMVVLFTAAWCGPCQKLKRDVLTKTEVQDALRAEFVPVQIDLTDQSSSNPNVAVALGYGVRGIPAVMAMTPEGEEIETFNGARDVASFVSWLDRLGE